MQLADGLTCSAGDTIITRQNDRTIPSARTDWVKNGDRWTVDAVLESGALHVIHLRTRRHITLPADYVAEHVELGYACTVHGAQGITADTCHTVATGEESRQLLYVAMTRGRSANHVYLTTAGDGDPHAVITRDALLPPTAVDILTRILARDDAPVSATSTAQDLTDPTRTPAPRGRPLLRRAHHRRRRPRSAPTRMAASTQPPTPRVPHLTDLAAYPALRAHLALCAVDGDDPAELLARAIADTRTGSRPHRRPRRRRRARLATRLLHRHRPRTRRGRPAAVAARHPRRPAARPAMGRLPARRGRRRPRPAAAIARPGHALDTHRRTRLGTSAHRHQHRPRPRAGRRPRRLARRHRRRTRRPAPHRRPQLPAAEARAQRALDQRVTRLLGDPNAAASTLEAARRQHRPERITADPYWPTLADRLTAADRAGIDITTLTRAVADDRPAARRTTRRRTVVAPVAAPVPRRHHRHRAQRQRHAAPGLDARAGRRSSARTSPTGSPPTPPGPPWSPPSPTAPRQRRDRPVGRRRAARRRPRPPPRRPTRRRAATPRRTHHRPDLADQHAHRPRPVARGGAAADTPRRRHSTRTTCCARRRPCTRRRVAGQPHRT